MDLIFVTIIPSAALTDLTIKSQCSFLLIQDVASRSSMTSVSNECNILEEIYLFKAFYFR